MRNEIEVLLCPSFHCHCTHKALSSFSLLGGLLAQFIMQTLNAAPTDPLLSRRGTRHEWRFVTRAQDKLVPQTPASAGGERERKAGQLRKPTLDASRPPSDKYVIQAASPACARVEMRSWPRKSAPHPLSTLLSRWQSLNCRRILGAPSPSPAEINFTCLMALALLNAEGERGRQAGYDGSSK